VSAAVADRSRVEYAALADRLRLLLLLRVAIAGSAVGLALASPGSLVVALRDLGALTAAYLLAAVALEAIGHRWPRASFAALTVALLLDGLFLAAATYATGGTESPLRVLIYLHLVAVSLLASYRTGLKIALWDSLLLIVVIYAQAAALLPPVDVQPGTPGVDALPVVNVTAFWLFALATSLFSALNERELRQRRVDLESLVAMSARLDDEGDPLRQATHVLGALVDRYAFPRGLVLGVADDGLVVLGAHGLDGIGTRDPLPVDPVLDRAWASRAPIALRRLDGSNAPALAVAMPGARRVIVAPMVADGRPVGAIVLEHPGRAPGVERRVMGVVAQAAGMAALNLRNAVLLRKVQDLAERDALTGAANRRSFQASLQRVLEANGDRGNRVAAVLFIDLDDFKVINDTLGHAAGDDLLVAVTERIAGLVREGDVIARLGGDEFAILTEDQPDLRRARAMAERLVRELRSPYQLGTQSVTISASIGVASARDAVDGAADMVRNADVAMYMAKAGGKSGFQVFDPGMHQAVRDRHEMAMDLQHAVERDQLHLRYQPIIDLATGRLAGVEALVRWQHPERGLISPGDFIQIAEEHGSILPIGRWVLGEACRQAAAWIADGDMPADLFVCVNVSAREVLEPEFVDGVREALDRHGVAPGRLVIELTETALLRSTPTTTATLQGLREMGARVVIDDFGTGFFSLSHLRQFPVDALKIAREFTQGTDDPAGDRTSALAAAIVAMAGSLGIATVAEGIETPDQAGRMRSMRCTYGQGYYFAHPLLPDELLTAMRQQALSDELEAPAVAPAPAEVPVPRARAPRRRPALAAGTSM
jgi:diguanylate cyclase (GGDEF)-like protein